MSQDAGERDLIAGGVAERVVGYRTPNDDPAPGLPPSVEKVNSSPNGRRGFQSDNIAPITIYES